MVIKITNSPNIKDVAWDIDKVKSLIPIKVLNSVGINFSSESQYKVMPVRRLKINELALYAKVDQVIDEDMVFMSLSDFFLEVQYVLEEPTDTIVDIFLNALNTRFSESDLLIIAMHNFCSLMKKVYERMCNMTKEEASNYFSKMTRRYYYYRLKGKVGNWLFVAFDNALYLKDPECKKQYVKYLNG